MTTKNGESVTTSKRTTTKSKPVSKENGYIEPVVVIMPWVKNGK